MSSQAEVSVIIPSLDGSRGGNVEKLRRSLEKQTLQPCEIIVSKGISPNGKARNEGAKNATGEFLVFIDDDVVVANDDMLERLVAPFAEFADIGITGPSQRIPEDSNWFQRRAARELPRSEFPVVDKLVDSDMVTHMCLCVPADFFRELGGENPDIVSGTDPDLRHRTRQAGRRVCVVPNCWAYHPMPASFGALMRMSYWKGFNSALVRKEHPEFVLELDEGFRNEFPAKKIFAARIARQIWILIFSLLTFKLVRFAANMAYAWGNLRGMGGRPRRG